MDPTYPDSDEDIVYLDNVADEDEQQFETDDVYVLDADGTLIPKDMVKDIQVYSDKLNDVVTITPQLNQEDIEAFSTFFETHQPADDEYYGYFKEKEAFNELLRTDITKPTVIENNFSSFVSDLRNSSNLNLSHKKNTLSDFTAFDLGKLLLDTQAMIFGRLSLTALMHMRRTSHTYLNLIKNLIETRKISINVETIDELFALFDDLPPKTIDRKECSKRYVYFDRWSHIGNDDCIAYLKKLRLNISKTVHFKGVAMDTNSSNFARLMNTKIKFDGDYKYWKIGSRFWEKSLLFLASYIGTIDLVIHVNSAHELEIICPFICHFKSITVYICFRKSRCVAGMYCEYEKIRNIITQTIINDAPITRNAYRESTRTNLIIPTKFIHNS